MMLSTNIGYAPGILGLENQPPCMTLRIRTLRIRTGSQQCTWVTRKESQLILKGVINATN